MLQDPEHFGEEDLDLVYVAKKLKEALALEKLLTEAGFDYLVEPDRYRGGIIFQTERVGAFFYVAPADRERVKDTIRTAGYQPYDVAAE